MTEKIQKVVIVGRDIDAWLTALTLQLAVSNVGDGIKIELLELPSALSSEQVFTTLPTFKALHDILGISESQVLQVCSGTYCVGQRFSNWSGAAAPFMHAYDTHGARLNNIDFLQYWLKATQCGLNVALEDFSLGAVCAKQGNFVLHNENTHRFSIASYGYHLSALDYVKTIAKAALKAGVSHKTVRQLSSVAISDGMITSVTTPNGDVVEGDLFIDASGVNALLMRELEKSGSNKEGLREDNYEHWHQWFACDKVITAQSKPLTPIPAYAHVSAYSAGWVSLHPLTNRTGVVGAFDSSMQSNEDALESMQGAAGFRFDNVELSPLAVGARRQSWIANVIAVGTCAANLDLLDAAHISPLQTTLSYLLDLFPTDKNCAVEADIFNRKIFGHAEKIRDFQIAHYKLNRRFNEPFWNKVREMDIPEPLDHKIKLFATCGNVSQEEGETFRKENWTSIFIGHGLIPQNYTPLVDKISDQELMQRFQQLLKLIAQEASEMPSLQTHMEMLG